jgi:putative membrane protein
MRKLTLITMIALTLGLFQACKSNKKAGNGDSTAATSDTSMKMTDTAKSGAMASTANPDSAFTTKAAIGGMAEVALGKLALSKSTNAKIKDFAQMMVTDHGKANDELMSIAKSKNITLPSNVDADHQKKMDDLSTKSGKDFDKDYVDAMIDGHKKTLDLMEDEAKNGKDADFKAFAAKTAPVVQKHLDAIKHIKNGMK